MQSSIRSVPLRAKSQATLSHILSAAQVVFANKGFDAATVAEIGNLAGVSEAAVFTYFHSKRALCVQVIQNWYAEVLARMDESLSDVPAFEDRLKRFVELHLRTFLLQGRGMCAFVLSEARAKGRGFEEVVQPLHKAYAARLNAILMDGVRSGHVRDDVPIFTLQAAILGLMEHLLWASVLSNRTPDCAQASTDVWKLVAAAIQA